MYSKKLKRWQEHIYLRNPSPINRSQVVLKAYSWTVYTDLVTIGFLILFWSIVQNSVCHSDWIYLLGFPLDFGQFDSSIAINFHDSINTIHLSDLLFVTGRSYTITIIYCCWLIQETKTEVTSERLKGLKISVRVGLRWLCTLLKNKVSTNVFDKANSVAFFSFDSTYFFSHVISLSSHTFCLFCSTKNYSHLCCVLLKMHTLVLW